MAPKEPAARAHHPIHAQPMKISTPAPEGSLPSGASSRSTSRNEDGEQAVARLWKKNRISPGSIVIYLQWVRRFRAYCQRRHLEETSQLTLEGLRRFLHAYVGPRRKGPVAAPTGHVAQNALQAWAWALRALRIPVPQWRAPRAPAKLTPLLAAYCRYRRSHCGIAEATLQRDIETAKAFLARLPGGSNSASQARVVDIDRFVSYLSARISKRTVADRCSSLRAFLRFLRITNRLRHDLATSVVSPRFPWAERPPRALPWADVRRILGAVRQKEPLGKRDFALLLMMATYGLGAAEVLGLDLEAVDWKSEILRVRRPKTKAEIDLPLLPPVAKALAAYLQMERPSHAQSRRIFLNPKTPYAPLTSRGIRHRIRHYAHQAGIDVPVLGAHVLRHSHATRQIDAGANPMVVSDILGHRRPSSTSVYVRVALRRLRAVALPVPR
jgi:integrase/recombinase XerD